MSCHKCGAKSRPHRFLYECEICKNKFCDDHCCNSSYVEHFKGLGFLEIEKVVNGSIDFVWQKYICQDCFTQHGPEDKSFIPNIFGKRCHIIGCTNSLGLKTQNIKRSCMSCGKLICNPHFISKDKVDGKWLARHMHYPLAEGVCSRCITTKSFECEDGECYTHPKSLCLKLVGGKIEGERKAIIVHGILSNPLNLEMFAQGLLRIGRFDSVWLFDDTEYQGRVNEGFGFSPSDLLGLLDIKRTAIKAMVKGLGAKALKVLDLPEYIVEGAGKNLASTIISLDWENVVLFGHSLGGLVVRCAAESFSLEKQVTNVITLGSPFTLWSWVYTPKQWTMIPNKDIGYLAILGKDDWVAFHREIADLTPIDDSHENLLKVVFPDHDHRSIHEKFWHGYGFDFIKAFLDKSLFTSKDHFYLKESKNDLAGCFAALHGPAQENDLCFQPGKGWIDIKKM